MKALYVLSVCILSLTGLAQQWIDSEGFEPKIGEQFILHSADVTTPLGPEVSSVWDARALSITSSQAVNITDPGNNPYGKEFEGARLCYSLGMGNYLFADLQEDGFYKYGGVAGETGLIMRDPECYFQFPLKLGAEWTDVFSSVFSSKGIEFERKGELKGHVTGEGTLIMPYGVISDVLRVDLVEELTDLYDLQGNPDTLLTRNVISCFLKVGNFEPILTLTYCYSDGELNRSYATFIDGSQVKNQGNNGPWRELHANVDAEGNTHVELISEKKGLMNLRLLDKTGTEVHSLEYIPLSPGPMTIPLPGFSGVMYALLESEGELTLLPLR